MPSTTTPRGHASTSRLSAGVARFVATEAASGIVLVAAAVLALGWANSPWRGSYDEMWRSEVVLRVGGFGVEHDLHHFVNDALMAIFFFVVGLEIKREAIHGELADRRVAALPVLAAVGGMVVPPVVYLALAGGGAAGRGWGIPMATDIAFALGVLALFGSRLPSTLKLFLLTLAVVDDLGAIAVIAVFYGSDLDLASLSVAAAAVAVTAVSRARRVQSPVLYGLLAVVAWYGTYQSGVHATIAGVALAFATPTGSDRTSADQGEDESPAARLEHLLHPLSSFVVLPLFALANAGVQFEARMLNAPGAGRVATAVVVALVLGKLIGILGGAWLGVNIGAARLPNGVRWSHLAGVALLGGIGFTVSLFIAGLAFTTGDLTDAAKAGILSASVVAAALGSLVLWATSRSPGSVTEAQGAE